MRVVRHKVEGAAFTPARWTGGEIVPTLVILHDTAGRLEKGNSAAYLASNPAKVSVHFVVERDGTITQQVPTNRRANHAGQSSFHGRQDCNGFALGIEIVNPGKMAWAAQGKARAWWGETFAIDAHGIEKGVTPEHGEGWWMPYPEAQLTAVIELLAALFAGIPSLKDIATHWYVSPGRKVDTNPLFPLDQVRARVLGREDPGVAEAEAASHAIPGDEVAAFVRVVTGGSGLNMRRWPSFNPNVLGSIPNGAIVRRLREGLFGGEDWDLVLFDGREGWALSRYLRGLSEGVE